MKFFLGFVICVASLIFNVSANPAVQSIPGGFTPVSADNNKINELAQFSLSTVAQQSGSKRSLRLVRVVSAQSQVVSGMNYKMAILVCEKNSTDDNTNNVDQKSCRKCDVSVWEQSWLNKKDVTNVACTEPAELSTFSNVSNNETQ